MTKLRLFFFLLSNVLSHISKDLNLNIVLVLSYFGNFQATPGSNNTTNVIHMFPPNIANATKEMVSELNETKKSNESDNMTATKGTVSDLNETTKSNESRNITVMPLRGDEPLKKLNESKRVDQNGEWISDPNEEECDPSNSCVDEKEMFIACLRVPGTGTCYVRKIF